MSIPISIHAYRIIHKCCNKYSLHWAIQAKMASHTISLCNLLRKCMVYFQEAHCPQSPTQQGLEAVYFSSCNKHLQQTMIHLQPANCKYFYLILQFQNHFSIVLNN